MYVHTCTYKQINCFCFPIHAHLRQWSLLNLSHFPKEKKYCAVNYSKCIGLLFLNSYMWGFPPFLPFSASRFEKTNEKFKTFNELSTAKYESLHQHFKSHTKMLIDMKKDLDSVFRRIRWELNWYSVLLLCLQFSRRYILCTSVTVCPF